MRSRPLLLILVTFFGVLFLTVAVYWPGLGGGFFLDDYQNLHVLLKLFDHQISLRQVCFSSDAGPLRRPVAMFTFALNMIFEGPDVWDFKYTNLMIHLLCGVLIFTLARQLFRLWRPSYSEERRSGLALLVASLWLLAPLLVSTTLYTVQRMAQLSALFSLTGLIAYVSGRTQLDTRPVRGWLWILAAVIIGMPLAGLSKENGFLLPLLLWVVEVFFFRFEASRANRQRLAFFFVVFLGLPILGTVWVLIFKPGLLLGSYVARPFTLDQRVMTETRVLFYYVRNLLLPNGEGMGLFHDDYLLSTSLLHPITTLMSMTGWAAVLITAVMARKRRWWPLLFGVCFFLAAQALESTIIPLELVFEYRNYLPSFGIFFSLVMALASLMEIRPEFRRPLVGFMVALPLLYGFATYQRASTWSSWTSVLLDAERFHPDSPRVHVELASLYSVLKKPAKAFKELGLETALRPDTAAAVSLQRLLVYCQAALPIPGSAYRAIPSQPASDDSTVYLIATLRALAQAVYRPGCPALDVGRLTRHLQRWIRTAPKNGYNGALWDIDFDTAQLLRINSDREDAIADLEGANRIDPTRPQPLLLIMRYQINDGRPRAAYRTLLTLRRQFRHPGIEAKRFIHEYAPIERAVLSQNRKTKS